MADAAPLPVTVPAVAAQTINNEPVAPAPTDPAPITVTPTPTIAPAPVAAPVVAPTHPPEHWAAGLNDEMRGYVQNKGFADPSAVVESYRNLEKLLGVPKDRLLKLPEKTDDVDGWNDVYTKMGRPKEAAEYELSLDPGEKAWSDWARTAFHDLGLTKTQGDMLGKKWEQHAKDSHEKAVEKYNDYLSGQEESLKKEWGAAFEKNLLIAKRATQKFEISSDIIDKIEESLGYAETMKFMNKVGTGLGESEFISGENQPMWQSMTPEAAFNKMAELKNDNEFVTKYLAGDLASKQEMNRLHKYAYPGNIRD